MSRFAPERRILLALALPLLLACQTTTGWVGWLSPSKPLEPALRKTTVSPSALANAEHVEAELASQVQFYPDGHPDVERVQRIVDRLVAQSSNPELPLPLKRDLQLRARVILGPTVNAFVAGAKYVYVFQGLLQEVESDDELAFVIGHELGHIDAAHGDRGAFLEMIFERTPERLCALSQSLSILLKKLPTCDQSEAAMLLKRFGGLVPLAYNRKFESEADALGVYYAEKAGYDAMRGADYFKRHLAEYLEKKQAFEREEKRINAEIARAEADLHAAKGYADVPLVGPLLKSLTAVGAERASSPEEKRRIAQAEAKVEAAREQGKKAKLQLKAQELLWQWSSMHPAPDYRAENIEAMVEYLRKGVLPKSEIFSPTLAVIEATNAIGYDCSVGRIDGCDVAATTPPNVASAPVSSGRDPALLRAQRTLNAQGYDCGTPDGRLGPRTRTCLQRYQERNALRPSGELDSATRTGLGQ